MPKILHIITSFENGALPNILLDLAPHWTRAGWQVEFLALEPLPEDQASVRRCRDLGYPLSSVNVPARAVLRALVGLRAALRRLKPDLVHTHLGRADVYTPWVKGRVPQVSTFHSVRQNSGRLTQWGWKWSEGRVAHRTGVSLACLDSLYGDGFLSTPHSVIYNPVDPTRLLSRRSPDAVKAEMGWTSAQRVALAVGRLVPVKDHRTLVAAFDGFVRRHPEWRLLIAGEGPLRAELEGEVRRLGIEGQVVLPGNLFVADWYHAADVVVFPSLWEGLGLVPLEALACGTPVASSRLPAVAEFLNDHETGRFFEPGNPASLEACLEALAAEPEAANAEALRGQAMVRERFAPELIAAQYDALYRRLIGA